LRYLVERPSHLVTKEELLSAIWPETIVSEGVLTTHVRAIRQALGDNAKAPRYLETVHRRGYLFIAPLTTTPPVVSKEGGVVSSQYSVVSTSKPQPTPDPRSPTPSFVGRETEITRLHQALNKALDGKRQIIFVTGEPGIGKTSLVEAFLLGLRNWEWGFSGPSSQVPISALLTSNVQSPNPASLDWSRTMHRTLRLWRTLYASVRSARTPGPWV
jgi:DNA-binding winged helix-turn-helix (wHTH) protein